MAKDYRGLALIGVLHGLLGEEEREEDIISFIDGNWAIGGFYRMLWQGFWLRAHVLAHLSPFKVCMPSAIVYPCRFPLYTYIHVSQVARFLGLITLK